MIVGPSTVAVAQLMNGQLNTSYNPKPETYETEVILLTFFT